MSNEVLQRFGKYYLLDRLGEGGMAEIFRARLSTLESNGRFVAIKRIHLGLHQQKEFLQMFKAEVQVTMRFTHPNIVQLYEFGEESNQPYIVMEYVEGRNLREILGVANDRNERIPIAASAHIIEQTAHGLHYAHTFTDRATGESLNLVHRDVSPHNILLSYSGNVKVIDFGVAKASTNSEATKSGIIKGKLRYLSPEQVKVTPLDARSDVFALGIVLWELLANRKLFVSETESDLEIMQAIDNCDSVVKKPSEFNSEVPQELDDIAMKALRCDPSQRFQSAEEMARSLRFVLANRYPAFGISDLSSFVSNVFKQEILMDNKQLQKLNAEAQAALIKQAAGDPSEDSTIILNKPKPAAEPVTPVAVVPTQSSMKPEQGQPHKSQSRPRQSPPVTSLGTKDRQTSSGFTNPLQRSGTEKTNLLQVRKQRLIDARKTEVKQKIIEKPWFKRAIAMVLIATSGGVGYKYLWPKYGEWVSSHVMSTVHEVEDLVKAAMDKKPEAVTAPVAQAPVEVKPVNDAFLTITTHPAIVALTIQPIEDNGQQRGPASNLETPITGKKISAGRYQVTVRNSLLGVEKTFIVDLKPGETKEFSNIRLDQK